MSVMHRSFGPSTHQLPTAYPSCVAHIRLELKSRLCNSSNPLTLASFFKTRTSRGQRLYAAAASPISSWCRLSAHSTIRLILLSFEQQSSKGAAQFLDPDLQSPKSSKIQLWISIYVETPLYIRADPGFEVYTSSSSRALRYSMMCLDAKKNKIFIDRLPEKRKKRNGKKNSTRDLLHLDYIGNLG